MLNDPPKMVYRSTYHVVDSYGDPAYVEVHWFECSGVPGRYREYVKEREGEWYFYDINEWEKNWRW